MRASEYNVEILKDQLENQATETSLVKQQCEKQKKYILIQRRKMDNVHSDLEFYKGNAKAPAKKAAP